MAPELALRRLPRRKSQVVLDPMMGSGTIPVIASTRGHRAIGCDIDPLALVIARTWGRKLDAEGYEVAAEEVVSRAQAVESAAFVGDIETTAFVEYWFDDRARTKLAALAQEIAVSEPRFRDPLWCAFSRLIITKDASVSRARDVSHSRPHRVRSVSTVDPLKRFGVVARDIARRHAMLSGSRASRSELRLLRADARSLPLDDRSVDLTLTSPPYLNAIDYLRGHRMTLVWMGYALAQLRELRGASIGTERGIWEASELDSCLRGVFVGDARPRGRAVLLRYAADLDRVLAEQARVLKPDGRLTLVVADGTLVGTPVRVARLCTQLARRHGFRLTSRRKRPLPPGRRYLPPPLASAKGALDRRMRSETALTFSRR